MGAIFKIDHRNFDFFRYAQNHVVLVCFQGDRPVGLVMAQLFGSVFDPKTKVLFQDVLWVEKSSGRAAHLLMREFIAFGRANAKLVFTCRAKQTNVKERTLKRLGFEKVEEIFRLEVN